MGLDVSTALLFADLDPDGRVVVKLPDGVKGRRETWFLETEKGLVRAQDCRPAVVEAREWWSCATLTTFW